MATRHAVKVDGYLKFTSDVSTEASAFLLGYWTCIKDRTGAADDRPKVTIEPIEDSET